MTNKSKLNRPNYQEALMYKAQLYFLTIFMLPFSTACSTNKVINIPTTRTVSGYVMAEDNGTCKIIFGKNTKDMTCTIGKKEGANFYLLQINSDGVFNQTPNCIFSGSAHLDKDNTKNRKIETIVTNISSSQIWIELPSYTKTMPRDAIAQFICIDDIVK